MGEQIILTHSGTARQVFHSLRLKGLVELAGAYVLIRAVANPRFDEVLESLRATSCVVSRPATRPVRTWTVPPRFALIMLPCGVHFASRLFCGRRRPCEMRLACHPPSRSHGSWRLC